jgi:hypothetical protein
MNVSRRKPRWSRGIKAPILRWISGNVQAKAVGRWRPRASPPFLKASRGTRVLDIDSGHPDFPAHALGRLTVGSVARCDTVVPCNFIIGEPRPMPSFPLLIDGGIRQRGFHP